MAMLEKRTVDGVTKYKVDGVPVSKEIYEKTQADQDAAFAKFKEEHGLRETDMDRATAQARSATEPSPAPNQAPVVELKMDTAPVVINQVNPAQRAGTSQAIMPILDTGTVSNTTTDSSGNEQVLSSAASDSANAKGTAPLRVDNTRDPNQIWKNRIGLSLGKGLPNELLTNALSGFNHRIVTQSLPQHRELQGYVFITRPDINLSEENIANSRFFSWLASKPVDSVEFSILAALDSECPLTNPHKRRGMPTDARIPFDNLQAFTPILTTQLRSLSGFPDQTLDVWMSPEGAFREQYGMVDSVYEVNNAFTLNATFNNCIGDPVMLYVRGIMEYASGVRRGLFKPKTYNQVSRRIDYQSRIYVFKFDPTGRRVINWGAAMVAWPMNDNEGSLLNYQADRAIVDDTREVNIQFQCIGARYRDPLLFETFNETVAMFNPDLIPDYGAPLPNNGSEDSLQYNSYSPIGGDGLVEISEELLPIFNWYGYPIVDPDTNAFRWFVSIEQYNRILREGGVRV